MNARASLIDVGVGQPTAESVDQLANDISTAIRRVTQETTPRAKICPFSKRWWNKALEDLRKQTQRARRRLDKYGTQEDEDNWKERRETYHCKMNKCKRETWQKFVSEADERNIWKVNKYLNSTPTNTYIPTLEGQAATNSQKTDILRKTFFQVPTSATSRA
jgi:hypothetical protein